MLETPVQRFYYLKTKHRHTIEYKIKSPLTTRQNLIRCPTTKTTRSPILAPNDKVSELFDQLRQTNDTRRVT